MPCFLGVPVNLTQPAHRAQAAVLCFFPMVSSTQSSSHSSKWQPLFHWLARTGPGWPHPDYLGSPQWHEDAIPGVFINDQDSWLCSSESGLQKMEPLQVKAIPWVRCCPLSHPFGGTVGFTATSVSPSSRAGTCTIPNPGRAIHNRSVLVPKTVSHKQVMFSLRTARVQGPHGLVF